MNARGCLTLALSIILSGCAGSVYDRFYMSDPPDIVPSGWIADFDSQNDPRSYLKEKQYHARRLGLTPYVYFYSDTQPHCRWFRYKVDRRKHVHEAFNGTQVIMLDAKHLATLAGINWYRNITNVFWPNLVKIESDGTFDVSAVLHIQLNWIDHPAQRAIKVLEKFFNHNNEA